MHPKSPWPPSDRSVLSACLAGAVALLLAPACAQRPAPVATAAATTLQFIADDYPRAREEAKRRNVPIFVEAWAPW